MLMHRVLNDGDRELGLHPKGVMVKKTIDDIQVGGKRVLVRLDLNVPLDGSGEITDDRRIESALPTIRKLLTDGGRLILMSHLGRPEGVDAKWSLRPVAERLSKYLGARVPLASSCIGEQARQVAESLEDGTCCLLENLRFEAAETIKDSSAAGDAPLRSAKDAFASALAGMGDVYVNDAFGTCHRDNASMLTVPQRMVGRPRVMGYLVSREIRFLGDALREPKRPFVVVLGGAKVSDKVGAIRALLGRCDHVLIGGAMALTFAASSGRGVGNSRIEADRFALAREIVSQAGEKLLLPRDYVCARSLVDAKEITIYNRDIPEGMMGLDIGPKTTAAYEAVLGGAGTVVWNGPMGVFETQPFDAGTVAIARALAAATRNGAITIVGGGDSAAAVELAGLSAEVTHVSTGGGATLEFLEGKRFAAIDVLDDA